MISTLLTIAVNIQPFYPGTLCILEYTADYWLTQCILGYSNYVRFQTLEMSDFTGIACYLQSMCGKIIIKLVILQGSCPFILASLEQVDGAARFKKKPASFIHLFIQITRYGKRGCVLFGKKQSGLAGLIHGIVRV